MSQPSWTDKVQAIAALATFSVTTAGLLFVYWQLRRVDRTIRSDTNANLCAQSIEILNAISGCPDSYACFYNDAPLPTENAARVRVLCVCEMIVNYLDHVCQQRDNLRQEVWRRWEAFVCDTVRDSHVVQSHLCKYENWYSPTLVNLVKPYCVVKTAEPECSEMG